MIMYCDRCGKEFDKWNYKGEELIGVAEFVYDHGKQYLDCQKDLCKSCYDELEKWWNFKSTAENTDTEPSKKHRDVNFKFYIGDKVKTLVETVEGDKLFPVGTIGVITDIDNDELPYRVESEEFNDCWYYPEYALELVDEDELCK
jgi:hypothetical protein